MSLAAVPDLPARADAAAEARVGRRRRCSRSCIPGMAYATSIVPEVDRLSVVRALLLAGRARARVGAAAAASSGSRSRRRGARSSAQPQFATVPAAFVIAAAGLWVTGARGRRFRRDWTPRRHDRRGRARSSARSSSSTASSCSTPRSGSSRRSTGRAACSTSASRPGSRSRRHGDPAGDRRPRLAAAAASGRRPGLPRVRRLVRARRSSALGSTRR